MKSPEAVTETKAGYKTADTWLSKVVICILVEEVRRQYSYRQATKDSVRRAQSNTTAARRTVLVRPPHHARGQAGESRRINSTNGHSNAFGKSVRSSS
jgi:hypothetical protein